MNGTAREHEAEWLAPVPLWGTADAEKPALVRIDGDDFMEQFAEMLKDAKTAAAALWAARPAAADESKQPGVLYQPVHGCYALVCASLTCKAAGRPEKAVAPARGESVGFLLRRVETDDFESAWIPSGNGEGKWSPTRGPAQLAGEELIPMFPVPAAGTPARRVWAGLVPTSSRETYTPGTDKKAAEVAIEALMGELESGPGEALQSVPIPDLAGDADAVARRVDSANRAAMQAALGLAQFLNDYILLAADREPAADQGPAADHNTDDITAALKNVPHASALVTALNTSKLDTAIADAWGSRAKLRGPAKDWPVFTAAKYPHLPMKKDDWTPVSVAINGVLANIELPKEKQGVTPVPRFEIVPDKGKPQARQYFIRCAYVRDNRPSDPRAKCPPPVVSQPSAPFAIAPVHDPGAPARTIRIPMPLDISIGGLRKLKKNVGFVLTAELNAKVQAFSGKKLKDIDDGNVSDGTGGDGEICTFALPIITLCAMIVLYIFLALLNIVFFWMPLVKICLPLPKGKSP